MNTKLNSDKLIKQAFTKKFEKEDDVKHLKQMISYRILGEVERITDERNILRNELAKILNVSPSYITQLYRGNKVVNLELLAQMEKKLNFRFEIKAVAPEILEVNNTSCEHSWNEEQILILVDKLKSPKGSWVYINNLWDTSRPKGKRNKNMSVCEYTLTTNLSEISIELAV
ncbi:MAG: helix-turn-helix transcriptional regulator [Flavipsychrobacter sp.]|nr:helix-turn-helix transcriptional regulator [Flavipsychrobacter sp.]